MTNPNLSLIAVVLDRSGSMDGIAADTVGSLNRFLADQRKVPGEARLTLALFNEDYRLIYNDVPVKEAPDLTMASYCPQGWTALYDAVGRTIDEIGRKLAATDLDHRPGRVLVMILTDGQENRSREYTADRIRQMIKIQREKYAWDFVFLGADLQAETVAMGMGIDRSKAMAYSATNDGMHRVMRSANLLVSHYRGAANPSEVMFSAQDRVDNAPSPAAPDAGAAP